MILKIKTVKINIMTNKTSIKKVKSTVNEKIYTMEDFGMTQEYFNLIQEREKLIQEYNSFNYKGTELKNEIKKYLEINIPKSYNFVICLNELSFYDDDNFYEFVINDNILKMGKYKIMGGYMGGFGFCNPFYFMISKNCSEYEIVYEGGKIEKIDNFELLKNDITNYGEISTKIKSFFISYKEINTTFDKKISDINKKINDIIYNIKNNMESKINDFFKDDKNGIVTIKSSDLYNFIFEKTPLDCIMIKKLKNVFSYEYKTETSKVRYKRKDYSTRNIIYMNLIVKK
jgi:hypothetical protein